MEKRKGFTLIELMVVIFIVGILAAVAIPIMRGRIDSAKWSEGRAGAGSIRTAARAFQAEKGPAYNYVGTSLTELGFVAGDLNGKYFLDGCYDVQFTAVPGSYDTYVVMVTASFGTADQPASPSVVSLDQDGVWDETP
jgi:type IV pilus assembly protein PilA